MGVEKLICTHGELSQNVRGATGEAV